MHVTPRIVFSAQLVRPHMATNKSMCGSVFNQIASSKQRVGDFHKLMWLDIPQSLGFGSL